ncbi:MAG: hypothetical protein ACAI35_28205 [Candidatus Methylacidiphilales bacterium]|nr:hypothetical protein [Candidatus Methylacidiphilales bacterium]
MKNPNGGKGSCIRLTDRAWGWAEENLTSPNVMSPVVKSQPAAEALQALLKNLAAYIHKSGVRLTDLVSVVKPVVTSITPINPEVLKGKTVKQPTLKAVRAAYLKLSDGKLNEPVRISLLATRVPHASPETFLKLLEQWNLKQHLFFARLDDPQSLTEDDHRYTIQHLNTEKHTVAFKS